MFFNIESEIMKSNQKRQIEKFRSSLEHKNFQMSYAPWGCAFDFADFRYDVSKDKW
jgi:hypothetical protein